MKNYAPRHAAHAKAERFQYSNSATWAGLTLMETMAGFPKERPPHDVKCLTTGSELSNLDGARFLRKPGSLPTADVSDLQQGMQQATSAVAATTSALRSGAAQINASFASLSQA
ncbi:MAG: hypothetical protein WBG11_13780, partial [Methylocella sp.]